MGTPRLQFEGDIDHSAASVAEVGVNESFSRFDFPEHEGKLLSFEYPFNILLTSWGNIESDQAQIRVFRADDGNSLIGFDQETQIVDLEWSDDESSNSAFSLWRSQRILLLFGRRLWYQIMPKICKNMEGAYNALALNLLLPGQVRHHLPK